MKRGLIIAAVVCLLAFVWAFDPVEGPAVYPRCLVKMLTGLDCPGCGSARALHAFLHGDVRAALMFNPWLPAVVLMILLALIGSFRAGKIRNFIHSPLTLGVFIALSLGWMTLRNIYDL